MLNRPLAAPFTRAAMSVVVEEPQSFYTIAPLIRRLTGEGAGVFLFTTRRNLQEARRHFAGMKGVEVASVEGLRRPGGERIDFYLKQTLTPSGYSSLYRDYNRFALARMAPWRRIAGTLLGAVTVCPRAKINAVYGKIWAYIQPGAVFPTRKVLCVTRCAATHLLNSPRHEVSLLVDSWDHPIKSPFFARAKRIYVWNRDLAADVRRYQGDGASVREIFPLKFRYLLASEKEDEDVIADAALRKELAAIDANRKDYYLYVCTGSSFVRNAHFFKGECRLIEALAKKARSAGRQLWIKPYPFYDPEEFDFLRDQDHVHLCPGEIPGRRHFLRAFDDQQLHYKVRLIRGARAIINVATTLVLEAALINPAVAQIRLDDDLFGSFRKYSENHHVRTYLNASPHAIGVARNNLDKALERIFSDDPALGRFGAQLRDWLTARTLDESLDLLIGDLLDNTAPSENRTS